jgi:hypothetical protein
VCHVFVSAVQLTTAEAMLADAGPSASVSEILDPYAQVFSTAFSDLHTIVADQLADPTPILSAVLDNHAGYVEQILADPASIADIPGEMARHLEDAVAVLTSFSTPTPI